MSNGQGGRIKKSGRIAEISPRGQGKGVFPGPNLQVALRREIQERKEKNSCEEKSQRIAPTNVLTLRARLVYFSDIRLNGTGRRGLPPRRHESNLHVAPRNCMPTANPVLHGGGAGLSLILSASNKSTGKKMVTFVWMIQPKHVEDGERISDANQDRG